MAASSLPTTSPCPPNDTEKSMTSSSTCMDAKQNSSDTGGLEDNYPDGGWTAWLVVFGAMCNTFTTFGLINSYSVFQSHYTRTILKGSSPSSIALIGSLQYALVFLPGIFLGRLFDLGYFKPILMMSSVVLVLSTLLVAECKAYWQFLVCQGLAVGLACGGIFGPATALIAHWFKKRLGLALGIHATGSSIGGTVFPILARKLIPRIGFPWTMRVLAIVVLVFITLTNLTMKPRLPPSKSAGPMFDIGCFRSMAFTTYCMSAFFSFLGIYTFLTYLDISAISIGLSDDVSFYFVAIANASSGVGRCAAGLLADAIGPINTMLPFTAIAGIMTFLWPTQRGFASFTTVTVLYGFASGSYISLLSHPLTQFGPITEIGRRLGMLMCFIAAGAVVGPPVSGKINEATGDFVPVGFYAGSTVMLGVGVMAMSRYLLQPRLVAKC